MARISNLLPYFAVIMAGGFSSFGARAVDNAAFVSQSVPASFSPGETRSVTITYRNTGTTTWTGADGYYLGSWNPMDNTTWLAASRATFAPGEAIAPGATKTFTFNVTAPTTAGSYNFQWRMVHDMVAWFGASTTNLVIPVTAPAAYDAEFVSQTVPSVLVTGQTAQVSITMRNTGTNVWTAANDYKLGSQNPQDNATWGVGRLSLLPSDSISTNATKTFTFNIVAPAYAGTYQFQWKMLRENLLWFGDLSTNVAIPVSQASVTLCPGVTVVPDGSSDLGPAIQQCIDAIAAGYTLELPAGTYGIATAININKPFTLRTKGLGSSTDNCEHPRIACAILKALPSNNLIADGFLRISSQAVTIDHLILDGNRAARLSTPAAASCAKGNGQYGYNARMNCGIPPCRFSYNVSKNALCGTALQFNGDGATIVENIFRSNGQNSVERMWADGLSVHRADNSTISGNTFIDNSDVALILGSGRYTTVSDNIFSQPGQVVFAALMLDNFNGNLSGDFTGTVVTNNLIDCGAVRNCHFGINLGPHAWYLSNNILGGEVHGNVVTSARQGINVDGAGTAARPLVLYDNTVTNPAPGTSTFQCGSHATSALNINTADSVVVRNGDTTPATAFAWHQCP